MSTTDRRRISVLVPQGAKSRVTKALARAGISMQDAMHHYWAELVPAVDAGEFTLPPRTLETRKAEERVVFRVNAEEKKRVKERLGDAGIELQQALEVKWDELVAAVQNKTFQLGEKSLATAE